MTRFTALTVATSVALLSGFANPAQADPIGGRIVRYSEVKAYCTDTWTFCLCGDETTLISLQGDGDTCLELRVYDSKGDLVALHTRGNGDRRQVSITPWRTGTYKVKVHNLGCVSNEYRLILE